MATLCPNCGAELPTASARFCSNCGTLLSTGPAESSESSSSKSNTAQIPSSASTPSETQVQVQVDGHSRPMLHEQIAQQPTMIGRGLRVKVWEADKDEQVEATSAPQEEKPETVKTSETVSNLPTVPLMTNVLAPVKAPEVSPHMTPSPDVHAMMVEQLDTAPLTSYSHKEPLKPLTPVPLEPSRAAIYSQAQAQNMFAMKVGTLSPGSRKPLFIVLAFVLVLLVVGVIAWALVLQPFSVPTVTNPQQHFHDTRFGLSLSYPTGWHVQVDAKASVLHFADSTSTAQVNITVSNAAGANEALYAQKLIPQLGMTNVKSSATLTFAGTSWLQFQGSVLEKGASYTETLLVTVHGAHLYTLAQLAPQGIYTQEDHLVFAPMRSSLQFLP